MLAPTMSTWQNTAEIFEQIFVSPGDTVSPGEMAPPWLPALASAFAMVSSSSCGEHSRR